MARPKQFDPTEALESAMEVFWQKGYEATSVQDLVNGMGINRASLYATFGDKHKLFVSALEHYATSSGSTLVTLLEAEGPALGVIEHALGQLVDWHSGGEGPPGCFMTNAAVELCQRCPDTAAKVEAAMTRLVNAFEAVLARGQAAGEISTTHSATDLARFLSGVVQAVAVMSKSNQTRATIEPFVAVALSALVVGSRR